MKRFTQFFVLLFLPLIFHISARDYEPETCPSPALLEESAPQATVHGISNASFKVDEAGNATYNIPIVMSPGVNDLQPNLSLSYSSSGGTSMLGFGWSLSGVPSITRAPNTIAQDCTDPNNIKCTSRAVKLTNSDQLAIAGERLKRISGSQFGNNSVYRTEQETWQRVTYYTSEGGYFIVNTPDGLKMTFGRGTNNRTRAAGTSTTLTWWLNRVEDQFGNYYTITYDNFSSTRSEVVPKEINYTGNGSQNLAPFAKVRFNYENHPYPRKTWIAGRLILQQRRLKSIETLVDNQLVRRYNMTYQVRSRSRNSYLIRVQECNSSNQCFEPITFQWGGNSDEDGIDLDNVQLIPNAGANFDKPERDDRKYFFIPSDYTGDGKSDMIHVYKENRFKFWRSNGNGTFHVGGEVSLPTSIDRDNWTILPGEFNGDHRMDIMYIPVSQSKRVRIGRSNGNGTFNFYEWYAGSSFGGDLEHDEVRTGDFNGDGLTDIINFSGDDIFVMLKTRTTLHSGTNAFTVRKTTPNYSSGDKPSEDADRVIIADFNGDGWDDIWHTPERHRLYVMLSKGDGTFAPPITHNYNNYDFKQPDKDYASYQFIPGDYNGDGLTDLVHISDDKYLKIFTSTGNGYFNISGQVTSNVDRDLLKANSQWRAGDFNGDGMTDLIHITNDRGVHFWYAEPKSNGDAGFNVRHNNYPDSGNRFRGCRDDNGFLQESDGNSAFFFVLDFTGNGRTDMVHFSDDACSYAWSSDTDASHKIIGFQNGPIINKIDVEYKYITDPAVYKGSKTYSYPKVRATGGLCVAYKSKIPNGISNYSKNETRYEYYDAFFNVHGRGFRGFEKVITYEYGRDYKHTVIYDRDDKCLFARVKQMDRHLISSNKLLERTKNRIIIRESVAGKKIYWSEFDQVEKWNYDLSSTSRASYMRTNYVFDSYANATRVEERHYGKSSTLLNYLKRDYKFYNNSSTWLLGKQTEEKTHNSYRSQSGNTITTRYHWDSQYKYIHREEREPGGPNELRLTTYYAYDGYGNKTWERLFGWDGKAHVSRSSKWRYRSTERFRFPYQIENAKGHKTSYTFDKKYGHVTQETDANNIWQKVNFDGFGRDIQSQKKGEGIIYKSRHFNTSSATRFREERINGRNAGQPTGGTYYDILGRQTRGYAVLIESGSEKKSYMDKVYNTDGTVQKESNPYFLGRTKYFTTYAYDKLDRQISSTAPANTGQSRVSRVSYAVTNTGLLTTHTNALNQRTYVYTDATGRIERVRDNLNNSIYYYYNGAGQEKEVRYPGNKKLLRSYDKLNRVTQVNDPDVGVSQLKYNGFDEVIESRHVGLNRTTRYEFDVLGRTTKTSYQDGTISTWTYDGGTYGKGKVQREKHGTKYEVEYTYDSNGRNYRTKYGFPGKNKYYYNYSYFNSKGQINRVRYSGGYEVWYDYDNVGDLLKVRGKNTSNVLVNIWERKERIATGDLKRVTLGNGITESFAYNSGSDFLREIRTYYGSKTFQDWDLKYNALGNITQRKYYRSPNPIPGVVGPIAPVSNQEDFKYDGLNRLISAKVLNRSAVTVEYDDLGNITYKSDAGCYKYNTSRPHAVSRVQLSKTNSTVVKNLTYDAAGQLTNYNSRFAISYNGMGQISEIDQAYSSNEVKFEFNANGNRVYQRIRKNGQTTEKYYIGGQMEEEITNGKIKRIHYIQAGGQIVAIRTTGNENKLRYLHKDHLGSVTLVTDEYRNAIQYTAYDAWGMRRTAETWQPFTSSFPANTGTTNNLQDPSRGFTFHEHLEIGDFIHMNARIYDPTLGKFLSPDPLIQYPDNLQSYNRYAYVLNNPLVITDPSGNLGFGLIIGGLIAGFIASTVTSQILSGLGINGVANALISAAAGFAASFAVAAANPVSSGGTASSSAAGSSASNFSFGDLAIELFQSAAPFIDEDLGKIVKYGGYVKSAVSLAGGFAKTERAGSESIAETEGLTFNTDPESEVSFNLAAGKDGGKPPTLAPRDGASIEFNIEIPRGGTQALSLRERGIFNDANLTQFADNPDSEVIKSLLKRTRASRAVTSDGNHVLRFFRRKNILTGDISHSFSIVKLGGQPFTPQEIGFATKIAILERAIARNSKHGIFAKISAEVGNISIGGSSSSVANPVGRTVTLDETLRLVTGDRLKGNFQTISNFR